VVALLLAMAVSTPTPDDVWLADAIERGGTVTLESRSYLLSRPLSLRDKNNVVIASVGPQSLLVAVYRDPNDAGWPIVDMVGAAECQLRNLQIRNADPTKYVKPAVGILLGRSSPRSAQHNAFFDVHVTGTYTVANVVNVGAELDTWYSPTFINGEPGGHNYVAAAWWVPELHRITTPHGPLYGGREAGHPDAAVCGVHTFSGGAFGVYGRTGTEVNLWLLPGAHTVTMTGTHFSNTVGNDKWRRFEDDSGGLAAVRIGSPLAPKGYKYTHRSLVFNGCWFECSGATYGFLAHDDADVIISGGRLQTRRDCFETAGQYVRLGLAINGLSTMCNYGWSD
jgi:hypothetical protein